jgi:hypothetical protein
MYSQALQQQKSNANKNEMQNTNVVSKPEFYALSIEALVFAVSLRLCTGK